MMTIINKKTIQRVVAPIEKIRIKFHFYHSHLINMLTLSFFLLKLMPVENSFISISRI